MSTRETHQEISELSSPVGASVVRLVPKFADFRIGFDTRNGPPGTIAKIVGHAALRCASTQAVTSDGRLAAGSPANAATTSAAATAALASGASR
jgi:hypothetical protein